MRNTIYQRLGTKPEWGGAQTKAAKDSPLRRQISMARNKLLLKIL